MAAPSELTTRVILTGLKGNLLLITNQLSDDSITRSTEAVIDLQEFWKKIELTSKAVSHEATKLSVAFTGDSDVDQMDPTSAASMRSKFESACLALVSTFYSLPKHNGVTLWKSVRTSLISLFESVTTLVTELEVRSSGSQSARPRCTGDVWEKCKALEKSPKNNKEAVALGVESERNLVADALQELQEAISNNDVGEEDEQTWNAEELVLVTPCVGLVKTAHVIVKKTSEAIDSVGSCATQNAITELDTIFKTVDKVSPAVDDFVGTLYPPMQGYVILNAATSLDSFLTDLLNAIRASHLCRDVQQPWMGFVTEALKHNSRKVAEVHSHRSG